MKIIYTKSVLLLFAIIITSSSVCFAQLSQVVSQGDIYSPPSPNASALLRYANVPVDGHTGIASVVLPIDKLSGRQLSIPVTISYHGSGNKVQDVASNVGLGFVLNAGGVITRVMRGLPDESQQGYQYYGKKVYSSNRDSAYLNATMNNKIDGEPDLFYFNFLGHTGKMVFDTLGNPQYLPDQGIRVIRHPIHSSPDSTNNKWVLKDLNGVTYEFGTDTSSTETTVANLTGRPLSSAITYISSWYLVKIISADGSETINFNYQSGPNLSYSQIRNITTYNIHHDVTDKRKGIFSSKILHSEVVSAVNVHLNDESTQIQVLNAKYLSSINNDMGSITFSYVNRSDVSGGKALSQMAVYNHYDPGTPLKTYSFNTSYFVGASGKTTPDTCRLRLDCVSLQGRSAETKQLYVFTYNNQTQLPPRTSDEFDNWGYYTKLNDRGSFPPVHLTTDATGNYDDGFDRRAADSVRMQAGILTRIRNVNGGYTNFYYQPNKYFFDGVENFGGGLRIREIVETDSLGQIVPITTQYSYTLDDGTSSGMIYNHKPYYIQGITNYEAGTVVKPIPSLLGYAINNLKKPLNIISTAVGVAIDIASNINPLAGLAINLAIDIFVPAVIDAWQFLFHRTHHYQYDSPSISISSTALNNLFDINGASISYSQVKVINPDGGYTVNYYTSQDEYPDSTSAIQMNLLAQPVKQIYGNSGSFAPNTSFDFERGLIKASRSYDNQRNLVSQVLNTYKLSRRLAAVTGQRSSISGYASLPDGSIQVITYNVGIYNEIAQNIQLVKSTTQLFDQAQNGSSITSTHNYAWQPSYPTLIHSESTQRSDGKWIVNYISYLVEYASGTPFLDDMVRHYMIAVPIEQVSALQDANGNISITGGVINRYKPGGLGLLDTIFSVATSQPINQANFKFSNQLTGAINSNYSAFSQDQRYIPKAFYQSYDSKNNLAQSQSIGGPPTSTIWGYNQNLPIAQISNASINQVAYTSFETNDQRFWTFSPTGRDSSGLAKTGKIRYQLSSGSISNTVPLSAGSYILSMWTQGAKPSISGTSGDIPVVNGETDNHSWNYYMDRITLGQNATITISGSGFIDEIRLYPQGAHMSTASIISQVGVSSVATEDDKVNTYEYDALDRVATVRDDQYNVLKQYAYSNIAPVPCTTQPDSWIGTNPVCYTDQTGIIPNFNNYSAVAVNSYGNLICAFYRTTNETGYIAKVHFTAKFSDSTTYSNETSIKSGAKSTLLELPIVGKSAESMIKIGIDTVINLSDDYGQPYQRFQNRQRVRDGYSETNTLTGGVGPYIPPVLNTVGCPTLFTNHAQTNFTKNDCANGSGSVVNYMVAAGTYSGPTQFAADSIARVHGQSYANTNGSCNAADTSFVGASPTCTTGTVDSGTPSLSAYNISITPVPGVSMLVASLSRSSSESLHDATISYTIHFNDGSAATYTTLMYKNQQSITISPPLGGYDPSSVISLSINSASYSALKRISYATRQRYINGVADGYSEANNPGNYYLAPIESPGACGTWYYNTPQSGFNKNDCGGSITGTAVSYTVPAHSDSSMVSQSYADALARLRGQTYANSNGGCNVGQTIVTTYAGNAQQGIVDGTTKSTEFYYPEYEAVDALGNVYISDGLTMESTLIRKITPGGTVTTLAGNTIQGYKDTVGTAAQFYSIVGLAVDGAGNVYAADGDNWVIRKITPTGVVSTLAGHTYGSVDGQGASAQFMDMSDIAIDGNGTLYVADNSKIRKITPNGVVSTFGGNGTPGYVDGALSSAEFNFSSSGHITVDRSGIIYVYDSGRIRKISNGTVSTLAGDGSTSFHDGTGAAAQLGYIGQLTTDAAGNIYATDYQFNCIRKITPSGVVTTITSNASGGSNYGYVNGVLSNAWFNVIEGIATDANGNMYVTDGSNFVVRKITPGISWP